MLDGLSISIRTNHKDPTFGHVWFLADSVNLAGKGKFTVSTRNQFARMAGISKQNYITDTRGYYISESSMYWILKANDLVTSPAYTVMTARDKFQQPTRAVNEMWQTDFTWFKVVTGAGTICAVF